MQEMQARVQKMEVSGTAGDGLVTCRVSGRFELKSIRIAPSLLNPQEAAMAEDLIVAAINDARRKAEKLMGDETEKIMTDLGLPPGLDLPL